MEELNLMNFHINGKHIDISQAYSDHIKQAFSDFTQRLSLAPLDVHITLAKDTQHKFRCDISAHIGRGLHMRCHENGTDAYSAFDNSLNKLGKIVTKHKDRLKDHHHDHDTAEQRAEAASHYILSEQHDEEGHPAVIAEMQVEIPHLSVSEAVMRLELQNEPYLLFYNKVHKHLNVVHYREDGNIGWLDTKCHA